MKEFLFAILGAAIGKAIELALDAYKRHKAERTAPTLARFDDVLKWGWDGKKLLRNLIDIDRRVIGDALTDQREGTVEQWAPIFTAHPESWALLN